MSDNTVHKHKLDRQCALTTEPLGASQPSDNSDLTSDVETISHLQTNNRNMVSFDQNNVPSKRYSLESVSLKPGAGKRSELRHTFHNTLGDVSIVACLPIVSRDGLENGTPSGNTARNIRNSTERVAHGSSKYEISLKAHACEDDVLPILRKSLAGEIVLDGKNCRHTLRSVCNWGQDAVRDEHLWLSSPCSGENCYLTGEQCCRSGPRMKCAACRIVCHVGCIVKLIDEIKFPCKATFRELAANDSEEAGHTKHHWVFRTKMKGKCDHCSKSFVSKLSFSSKDISGYSCSWCKARFHDKNFCFKPEMMHENCSFGVNSDIIVPPSWIVQLPCPVSLRRKNIDKNKKRSNQDRFVVKPVGNASVKPLIVFLNPKSGGNQGTKLLQKFQWLLNPRQVFDLSQGGPRAGLELYRRVPQLRILACGGDGTVGWILSVLDEMNFHPPPSIAVLPLGTGNDLSRSLGWGGGYADEPIRKILRNISAGECQLLDRWRADVVANPQSEICEPGKDNLPLNVINNYFSLGVDAQIALQFHEAREAHPEKFNSRLRNKMFYGQAGGKDLVQRKWKDLSEYVTIVCDNHDITPKLKDLKVHAVLFLNICSYGGGTHPWGGGKQSTSDGFIEVVGLTTYQLPLLRAGVPGSPLAKCKSAKVVTRSTIPMQVDGEACRVNPSVITISHLNCARMIAKSSSSQLVSPEYQQKQVELDVMQVELSDYEHSNRDPDLIANRAVSLGSIRVDDVSDLQQVRKHVADLITEGGSSSTNWLFIDSYSTDRCFRIDPGQEHLHFVTDICSKKLFVLNMGRSSTASSPDERRRPVALTASQCEAHCSAIGDSLECVSVTSQTSTGVTDHDSRDLVLTPQQKSNHLLEHCSAELVEAAARGDIKEVSRMCEAGVSPVSIDQTGSTALHVAAEQGDTVMVRYLLVHGPDTLVDMQDSIKGRTALHRAAMCGHHTVSSMLVSAGASVTLCDTDGNTARHLADQMAHQQLVTYLQSQEKFQSSENAETAV